MAKTNIQEELRLLHTIPPVFNRNSKILILGSFPSVKSREAEFFYGHKQNRFWKVLANLLNESVPENAEEKKQLLLSNGIALWDVIKSCTITGSSDSSIKNVVPNDIEPIYRRQIYRKFLQTVRPPINCIKSIFIRLHKLRQ